jgi:glycosyltransferase involved in cell wall biosynthesis
MPKRLTIFFPSAAMLLTDHRGHGEGLIAWNVCCGLVERGHEVVACAREVDLSRSAPFDVIETGFASRWESLEPLAYARRVTRLFEKLGGSRRFDVAHWLFPQGRDEVLFALPAATRVFVGPHSLEWPGPQRSLATPGDLARWAMRPAFKRLHYRSLAAASAVFVSVPDAVEVIPARFRAKVRVLPFGVDTERFRPAPLPSTPTVLFIGRLERAKGVGTIVSAAVRVRATLPDVRIRVAGGGPEADRLRKEANRAGLSQTLELLGPVPHDETARLLDSSSVLFAPARGEPFGMTVLEAMACGRAVVALNEGGPRFLLDGSSNCAGRLQLVDSGDPEALGDALSNLLRDRGRLAEVGRANRSRVEAAFSLKATLDALEEQYLEALEDWR